MGATLAAQTHGDHGWAFNLAMLPLGGLREVPGCVPLAEITAALTAAWNFLLEHA